MKNPAMLLKPDMYVHSVNAMYIISMRFSYAQVYYCFYDCCSCNCLFPNVLSFISICKKEMGGVMFVCL